MRSPLALVIVVAGCVEAPPLVLGEDRADVTLENGVDWNGVDLNGVDWNGVDWNGVDWNGVDWNGIDWNGVDWNGVDWNGVDWNGVDWNGVDWNGVDWNGVDWADLHVVSILGEHDGTVHVHPDARPLFLFVRAAAGDTEVTLAVPSPGAMQMVNAAPEPAAAVYFLARSWEIAYGPGLRFFAGFHDLDGDGEREPVVRNGRLGLAPSLGGLGPYVAAQVEAWSSMIGNLLNVQPFELSLRAYDVEATASDAAERARYDVTDLRGAIGRILPPPHTDDPPILVLLRDRTGRVGISTNGDESEDQLDERRACPLQGAWSTCYDGTVYVANVGIFAGPNTYAGCDGLVETGPYTGTIAGRCWVELPGLSFEQDAAVAPITASFVDMEVTCSACNPPPGL